MSGHWRLYAGAGLFVLSELLLFGSAEGVQKWQWIEIGSIPNALLTAGFILCRRADVRRGGRPSWLSAQRSTGA